MTTAFKAGTRKTKRAAAKAKARPAFAHREPFAAAPVREQGEWVKVSEAAEQLGISATTVRRRVTSGELRSRNALTGKHTEVFITA